jgi:LysM repeat protein
VVVLTVLVLLVVAGICLGHVSSQAASSAHRVAPRTVTVAPGETLWQLATRIAPHADPRLVIDQILRLNHLSGAGIVAGEQLVVPRAQ